MPAGLPARLDLFQETLAQRAYAAGKTAAAVPNGEKFKILFTNPAGSGVAMAITQIVFASRTNEFFTLRINPTTALPANSLSVGNRWVGGPVGKATAKWENSATGMTGGVALEYSLAATNNSRNESNLLAPFVLPPGFSVGAELNNVSGSPTDVTFTAIWVEVPI